MSNTTDQGRQDAVVKKLALADVVFCGETSSERLEVALPASEGGESKLTREKHLASKVIACGEKTFLHRRIISLISIHDYLAAAKNYQIKGVHLAAPRPNESATDLETRTRSSSRWYSVGVDMLDNFDRQLDEQLASIMNGGDIEFADGTLLDSTAWDVNLVRTRELTRLSALKTRAADARLDTNALPAHPFKHFHELDPQEQEDIFAKQFETWIWTLTEPLHDLIQLVKTLEDAIGGPYLEYWFNKVCMNAYKFVLDGELKNRGHGDRDRVAAPVDMEAFMDSCLLIRGQYNSLTATGDRFQGTDEFCFHDSVARGLLAKKLMN